MRVFLWNVDFVQVARRLATWCNSARESIRSGGTRRKLTVWIRANGWFALASLAIATVIYLLLRDNLMSSQICTLKVDVLIIEGEKRISGAAEPREVEVQVWGKEADVNNFVRETKTVQLRIPKSRVVGDASGNGGSVKIKPQRDIPNARKFGVLATPVGKGRVSVTFDEQGEVEFRIAEPVVVGTPHHRTVKSMDYNPKVAKVRGGKSRLSNLKGLYSLELEPVDVKDRADDYVGSARIRIPHELGELGGDVELADVTEVEVRVTFEKREKTKTFTKLPVRFSIAPGTVIPEESVLEPTFVSAKVTGYDESVDALSNNMVTAFAVIPSASTLNNAPGATNTLPVELVVPHNSEIWDTACSPPAVRLVMPAPPPAAASEPPSDGESNPAAGAVGNDAAAADAVEASGKSDVGGRDVGEKTAETAPDGGRGQTSGAGESPSAQLGNDKGKND